MKIKKLNWRKRSLEDKAAQFMIAEPIKSICFTIDINFPIEGKYWAVLYTEENQKSLGKFKDIEKAKEKCQKYFEKIILRHIEK